MSNRLPHSERYDRLAAVARERVLLDMIKRDVRLYLAARRRQAVRS